MSITSFVFQAVFTFASQRYTTVPISPHDRLLRTWTYKSFHQQVPSFSPPAPFKAKLLLQPCGVVGGGGRRRRHFGYIGRSSISQYNLHILSTTLFASPSCVRHLNANKLKQQHRSSLEGNKVVASVTSYHFHPKTMSMDAKTATLKVFCNLNHPAFSTLALAFIRALLGLSRTKKSNGFNWKYIFLNNNLISYNQREVGNFTSRQASRRRINSPIYRLLHTHLP